MKSVLIVSHYFYPENTPRAFRATELAREFARRGDKVYILLPHKACFTSDTLLQIDGLEYLNFVETEEQDFGKRVERQGSPNRKPHWWKRILNYFFPRDPWRLFDKDMYKTLLHFKHPIDICIAVSQPLSIHICFCMAALCNKILRRAVSFADLSDPPYQGKYMTKVFPLYGLWGYVVSPFFDYFMVPFEGAVPFYRRYKCKDRIKVIPQGFRLDEYQFKHLLPATHQVPVFAYAGTFYRGLRDPEYFFAYLKSIAQDEDFHFKLYVPGQEPYFVQMLHDFAALLPAKIQLCQPLDRMELLAELANVDFVVDIGNENTLMKPSKLIDYGLIDVPVYSFNKKSFSPDVFIEFLHGNYVHRTLIDVTEHDIVRIVDTIETLAKNTHE